MRLPQVTTWRLMALVAVIAGCFAIGRVRPALVAWLLLLIAPVTSWTALQCERRSEVGPSLSWDHRLGLFLNALFWCVSLVVATLVAMILVSPWFEALD
jgi:hypothetical protein